MTATTGPTTAPRRGVRTGTPVVLDPRTRRWGDGSVLLGGAPWRVVRLAPGARAFVERVAAAGDAGAVPDDAAQRDAADRLVARGLLHPRPLHPCPRARPEDAARVQVVVPAYGRPDLLAACLAALTRCSPGVEVVVVDDASPTPDVERVARAAGARVVRHPRNRGPAAARNTGLRATDAPVVAFVDSDCTVTPGWLAPLLAHFDDARVAAVAPRIRPRSSAPARGRRAPLLARHEAARSALDMGARPALVRPGAPLGFLPSATLLVRRHDVEGGVENDRAATVFDEAMRLGEDVDLVWRLADAGRLVRYEPASTVHHEARLDPREWARRRYEYGTSAADLDARHPGRLAPARPSAWNLAALVALAAGRPRPAAGITCLATATLARTLARQRLDPAIATLVVPQGVVADAVAIGHALRREWWPLGWLAIAVAARGSGRRASPARLAAAAMLGPVALEWWRSRPDVDPARYAALRLVEDAAYGSGVLVSAVRARRPRLLLPTVRFPRTRRTR